MSAWFGRDTDARSGACTKRKLTDEDQARLSNFSNNPPREPTGEQITGMVHAMRAGEQSANGSDKGSDGSAYSASGMQPSGFDG